MLFWLILLTTVITACLAGLTVAFYALLKPTVRTGVPDSDLPFVSVVVPARNEELKIERCLRSLLAQDYPNFELVVIDDRSVDQTGEIIRALAADDHRIRFVEGKTLPEGWIGKCNALVHAAGYAGGEWLLFTDADTCHGPESLRRSVATAMAESADLISFVPVQELGSFWERAIMPTLLGSFLCGDPFHTVNQPEKGRAYAYGQYILVHGSAYRSIGGHRAIRDEIVEDHALGRVFKEKGFKILVADGRGLYSVRMYTDLESLWQGWTKNLYSLIECNLINLLIVLFLINCAALLPFVELAATISLWLSGGGYPLLEQATLMLFAEFGVLFLWYRLTLSHLAGVNWRHFFLLPLGSLSVTALYLHATYLVLSGTAVNWKGRQYRVNATRTIEQGPAVRHGASRKPVVAHDIRD